MKTGLLALVGIAVQAGASHAQSGQGGLSPARVTLRARTDSGRVDTVRVTQSGTRAPRLRPEDARRVDSLLELRQRMPVSSPAMLQIELQIDSIMRSAIPLTRTFVTRDNGDMAVFVDDVQAVQEKLMVASKALTNVAIPRGYMGMVVDGARIGWTDSLGMPLIKYAEYPMVVSVDPNSPASKGGIRFGDLVIAYDGADVQSTPINLVRLLEPGRTVDIRLRRDGDLKETSVIVEKAPPGYVRTPLMSSLMVPSQATRMIRDSGDRRATETRARATVVTAAPGGRGGSISFGRMMPTMMPRGILGVELTDIAPDGVIALSHKKSNHGVLVTSVPIGSPGARVGLLAGDIIVTVGDMPVMSVSQLHRAVLTVGPDKSLTYVVVREGKTKKLTYDPK